MGQNVNAYHGEGKNSKSVDLAYLLDVIGEFEDIKRIRYMTSHPNDMSEDLIYCYRDCEKLMPLLHLPVQSGSDKILKLMNRKHTIKQYLAIFKKLRNINKDFKISSDFIISYPGEDENDFRDTR